MRTLIIFLLLCVNVYAEPFLKGDCIEAKSVVVNGIKQSCPLSVDIGILPFGLNDFSVTAIPEGEALMFQIRKTESRRHFTYKIYYKRADKRYFDKRRTKVKIKK